MAIDAAANVSTDEFAETLTYKPYNGAQVDLSMIVDRHPPQRVGEASIGLAPGQFEITIAISLLASISLGKDKIAVADRPGGTAVDKTVKTILDSRGGVWKLAV